MWLAHCQKAGTCPAAYDGHMTQAPTGYPASSDTQHPSIAKVERALLCDLLDEVGPHHPTLCEGWTTHHLAAHLKLREGNPIDFVRNILPGDQVIEEMVASQSFSDLVEKVRQGPTITSLSLFAIPRAGEAMNTLEFLIHHEDVRRGEGAWEPRELPTWVEDTIWGQVVKTAKLSLLRNPRELTLRRSDTGDEAKVSKGSGSRLVTGRPLELALYVSGRKTASRVERSS